MKKVILFGATGQLGRLVSSCTPYDIDLHCFSSDGADLSNFKFINTLIQEINPDLIINAAAYTQVDKAEEEADKAFIINADAVKNIAENTSDDTRIIHLSTDFVFGGEKKTPCLPYDPVDPLSVYGKSKAAGEAALLATHPLNCTIIRTSWLYSAQNKNFVTTMLSLMQSRDVLGVVNDQFGSPTSAQTLAEVIWRFAMKESVDGIYHWSDRGEITWYDFALEIYEQARQLGLVKSNVKINPITTAQYPTPAVRPQYSALDSSATEELLGISTIPWKDQLFKVLTTIKEID